jgi:hypothetical protein
MSGGCVIINPTLSSSSSKSSSLPSNKTSQNESFTVTNVVKRKSNSISIGGGENNVFINQRFRSSSDNYNEFRVDGLEVVSNITLSISIYVCIYPYLIDSNCFYSIL